MGNRREDWVEIFRALGEAFFAVLRSEWDVLRHEWWRGSFRKVLIAVAVFFVAACLLFMLVALLVTAAVQGVQDVWNLKPWAATLWIALAVLLATAGSAAVGYFVYVKRFRNPITTATERLGDHLSWWRERLLRDELSLPEGDNHGEPDRNSI